MRRDINLTGSFFWRILDFVELFIKFEVNAMQGRPFVGVMFECCNVYGRAYLNKKAKVYEARCPRCYHSIRLQISKDGSQSRFFTAG